MMGGKWKIANLQIQRRWIGTKRKPTGTTC